MEVKGREKADWGFQTAEIGWHKCYITEGIEINTKEDTGKKTLLFQFEVFEGRSKGAKLRKYVPMGLDFGEQMVQDILVCAGVANAFEKKFPANATVFDEQVIDGMKMKLPGCEVSIKVTHREYDGKTYAEIDRLRPAGVTDDEGYNNPEAAGNGTTPQSAQQQPVQAAAAAPTATDGW